MINSFFIPTGGKRKVQRGALLGTLKKRRESSLFLEEKEKRSRSAVHRQPKRKKEYPPTATACTAAGRETAAPRTSTSCSGTGERGDCYHDLLQKRRGRTCAAPS